MFTRPYGTVIQLVSVKEHERRASELGAELLGFYHSHPDHPARPSQYDLDHAFPTFSYIIVSVRGGTPEDMTSWRLRDDRSAFDPEELVVALPVNSQVRLKADTTTA